MNSTLRDRNRYRENRKKVFKSIDLLKIGKPIKFTANQHLLFRVDKPSRRVIGIKVVDASMKQVGMVHDLFGPVENPFLSVSLSDTTRGINEQRDNLISSNYFLLFETGRQPTRGDKRNKSKARRRRYSTR